MMFLGDLFIGLLLFLPVLLVLCAAGWFCEWVEYRQEKKKAARRCGRKAA